MGLVEKASVESGLSRQEIVKEGLRLIWAVNKDNFETGDLLEKCCRQEGIRYRSRKGTAIQATLSGVELEIANTLLDLEYCETKSEVVKLALQAYANVHL